MPRAMVGKLDEFESLVRKLVRNDSRTRKHQVILLSDHTIQTKIGSTVYSHFDHDSTVEVGEAGKRLEKAGFTVIVGQYEGK